MEILVARTDFRFDRRDLLSAAGDSLGLLQTFLRDVIERLAVAFERSFLARLRLAAEHRYVNVVRIELYSVATRSVTSAAASVAPPLRNGS